MSLPCHPSFTMKSHLLLILPVLFLSACVDTTGLSPKSSRQPTGNPQAAVTVTEFGDLQCPACRAAYTAIQLPLLGKYDTQIRYEFKHFPLRTIHRYALDLVEGSECAADKGKFWQFEDIAYTKQDQLNGGSVVAWAKELGIYDDTFSRCIRSHIKRQEVLADYDEGIKLGVQGTPTFFIDGRPVQSTLDAISAAVDTELKGQGQRL